MSIATWNWKSQDAGIRHMGPMAQDFYAAFGLGETDKGISTVDGQGVALAAIQGLYQVVQEKDASIEALKAQIETQRDVTEIQKRELRELRAAVDTLAARDSIIRP